VLVVGLMLGTAACSHSALHSAPPPPVPSVPRGSAVADAEVVFVSGSIVLESSAVDPVPIHGEISFGDMTDSDAKRVAAALSGPDTAISVPTPGESIVSFPNDGSVP
jgi:hypothetical protein